MAEPVGLLSAPFKFTTLAENAAKKNSSVETVSGRLREELAPLLEQHGTFVLHVVHVQDEPEVDFLCSPALDESYIHVDLTEWIVEGPLEEGPFKGYCVRMPHPASAPDD